MSTPARHNDLESANNPPQKKLQWQEVPTICGEDTKSHQSVHEYPPHEQLQVVPEKFAEDSKSHDCTHHVTPGSGSDLVLDPPAVITQSNASVKAPDDVIEVPKGKYKPLPISWESDRASNLWC